MTTRITDVVVSFSAQQLPRNTTKLVDDNVVASLCVRLVLDDEELVSDVTLPDSDVVDRVDDDDVIEVDDGVGGD